MNKEIEIPEGYKARIEGNKVIIELKESEEERIRKSIILLIQRGGYMSPEDKTKAFAWLEKQKEPKPAEWSDEDEKIYQSIMDDTVQENQLDGKQINWLEDIKYRYFPQSQQEWSEEDNRHINTIIRAIHGAGNITPIEGELAENGLNPSVLLGSPARNRWRHLQEPRIGASEWTMRRFLSNY